MRSQLISEELLIISLKHRFLNHVTSIRTLESSDSLANKLNSEVLKGS